MSDIFIAYSRTDSGVASLLARRLEGEGWSVFMDVQTPVGTRWDEKIRQELESAKAVVALWSANSCDSDYVWHEANIGRAKKILFPAFIEGVECPYGFGRIQTADLVGWAGDKRHPGLAQLLTSLKEHLRSGKGTPGSDTVTAYGAVQRAPPSVLGPGQTVRGHLKISKAMSKGKRSLRAIASSDARLGSRIDEIWGIAGELQWAQRGSTTQGREHCERVEENALLLLRYATNRAVCTPTVAFILSAAAALHDVGKIVRGTSTPTPLGDHSAEGGRRIRENAIEVPFPDLEFKNIIADVVGVHANTPFSSIPAGSRQCNGQEVWPRSLAAIFRLADMLDATGARTPSAYCKSRGALFENHREVWLARGSITGWTCDEDSRQVLLQARPSSPEAARAVETLIRLTNKDLHRSHKEALRRLQFGRATGHRPPIECHLPTKVCLCEPDRTKVRESARQFPRGYIVHDRIIVIKRPADTQFAVDETFYVTAMQPINKLPILAALAPVSLSRLLADSKLATYEIFDRTVEVRRSFKENVFTKIEMRYEATERVVRIDPELAVFNSATVTLMCLDPTTIVSAFEFTKNGPRTPIAATCDERSEDGERVIEYRISAADPKRVYEFRW